ncbi:MAG: FtsX-like permease family protein [Luteitalea sp.]|nr:FtsX-like permease family protein [Luteitalea sp.]
MRTFIWDMRYVVRSLAASPAVTVAAIVTIALGIGAATTTYSVVEAVVLRPLPFHEPDRLFLLHVAPAKWRSSTIGGSPSRYTFERIRSGSRVFEGVAGQDSAAPILTGLGEPERIRVWQVTSNLFSLLGVQPLIGRAFTVQEEQPGSNDVVILSYSFWVSRFDGVPAVLGRTVTLDGQPSEIVGVMPPHMNYPADTAMWRAFGATFTSRVAPPSDPQGRYWVLGRLRDGISLEQASANLDALTARIAEDEPRFDGWVANLTPLHDYFFSRTRTPLLLMLGAVALVLLVACANVANLLLARVLAREREISIRLALGSSRGRIVRQVLSESVTLALAAGGLGVLIATWGVPAVVWFAASEIPALATTSLNGHVLAVCVATTLLTGILFGLVPAWHASRDTSPTALRYKGASVASWRHRASDVFVVSQVAVTLVLVIGAGLLVGSFLRIISVEPGIDADRVVTAQVGLPAERYGEDAEIVAFSNRALERLRALPGVSVASVSTGVAFSSAAIGTFTVVDRPDAELPMALISSVSPEYFRTFGIRLRRGRVFQPAERNVRAPVIINEWLADQAFPGRDPLGKQITFYGGQVTGTIVGVVSNTRQPSLLVGAGPERKVGPEIYTSLANLPSSGLKLNVRAGRDTHLLIPAMRRAIREIDPLLPIDRISTMSALISDTLTRQRFYTVLLSLFAALTLLVAAAGVFGMMTFAVTKRTHEFGIRIALGARSGQILSAALRPAAVLTFVGLAAGLLGAQLASRLLSSFLYGISPSEPYVIAGSALVVVAAAMAAGLLPAWRATRVDPAMTLRAE